MGVHGLTSFVDDNPFLLMNYDLHNCKVVVDGNNFIHFLYYHCKVGFHLGGDYDVFGKKMCLIMDLFKSCNIEVFVVFDGAYALDGLKQNITNLRAKDRIRAAQRIIKTGRGCLLPCLAAVVFKQTLDKLHISYVHVDFEADNQAVVLANKWNCPVLSNDSDFYVYNLNAGFIPLNYIDFRVHKKCKDVGSSTYFLSVQLFHLESLFNFISPLNFNSTAIFGTLLGNDYMSATDLKLFYNRAPVHYNKRSLIFGKHEKVSFVMHWLEEQKNATDLLSTLLHFINPKQKTFEMKLKTSISQYTDILDFHTFSVTDYFEGCPTACRQKTDIIHNVDNKILPLWFVAACRCGKLPISVLNAAVHHKVYIHTQVENVSLQAASCAVSRSIREVIYGILLQENDNGNIDNNSLGIVYDTSHPSEAENTGVFYATKNDRLYETVKCSSTDNNLPGSHYPSVTVSCVQSTCLKNVFVCAKPKKCIVEYVRMNASLSGVPVFPHSLHHLPENIPSLSAIPDVSVQCKKNILFKTLKVTEPYIDKFTADLQLYMACISIWLQSAEPEVSLYHLKSVILSMVLLHVHKEIFNRKHLCAVEDVHKEPPECQAQSEVHSDGESNSLFLCKSDECTFTADYFSFQHLTFDDSSTGSTQTAYDHGHDSKTVLSVSNVCMSSDNKLLCKVADNLHKYHRHIFKISAKNKVNVNVVHSTAQLQCVVLDAISLNCLLLQPLFTPQPSVLINASFIYLMVKELHARSNPDNFLAEMLVRGSKLHTIFNELCFAVAEMAGKTNLTFTIGRHGRKHGRKATKRLSKDVTSHSGHLSPCSDVDDNKELPLCSVPLCNRFNTLCLET